MVFVFFYSFITYFKIHPLYVYDLVIFSKFKHLCNNNHNLVWEHFQYLINFPHAGLQILASTLSSRHHWSLFCALSVTFSRNLIINEIIQYIVFCIRFFLLIVLLRFNHNGWTYQKFTPFQSWVVFYYTDISTLYPFTTWWTFVLLPVIRYCE